MSAKSYEPIAPRAGCGEACGKALPRPPSPPASAMLMQPFSLTLYGWSFVMMLVGTLMFTIVTKLPE